MIGVFALLWLAGWVLAYRFRRPRSAANPGGRIELSIIIPARNEAHNLPKLLDSLKRQTVNVREILVVDDGSSDLTADIAGQMGATVIASQALPAGWRGKTWACHQGALAASGDCLLFMDADTWFEPGGLERVLALGHPALYQSSPIMQLKTCMRISRCSLTSV